MKDHGEGATGTIQNSHFRPPEVVGFHLTMALAALSEQGGKFPHPGTDVETPSSTR
jgi:hypothetical protein